MLIEDNSYSMYFFVTDMRRDPYCAVLLTHRSGKNRRVGVVVITSALHAEGRGFETRTL